MNLSWSEHMHVTVILCSPESLVSTATTRGSIRPALMSEMPSASKTMFLLCSSASASAPGGPPLPSPPNCVGSMGADEPAAGAGAWSATCATALPCGAATCCAAAPPGALPSTRMNLMFALPIERSVLVTASALLPSSALNLPPWTVLSRNPMCPSEPKSSCPPQS